MARVDVERIGGFAGFGGPGSRLQSSGTLDTSALADADRDSIERLFASPAPSSAPNPDGYVYRLTRQTLSGSQTVEVPEQRVPDAVRRVVKDRIVGDSKTL